MICGKLWIFGGGNPFLGSDAWPKSSWKGMLAQGTTNILQVYGLTTPNQSKSGNTYQNVAANISGLTTHTTYHFRIVTTNSASTRYGSDRIFTTQ